MEQFIRVNPKCMPLETDGSEKTGRVEQVPTLFADGWFRPCCWFGLQEKDAIVIQEKYGLLDEELHITNIEDVPEDVFNSKQWNKLINDLYNNQKNLPWMCRYYCGENIIHQQEGGSELVNYHDDNELEVESYPMSKHEQSLEVVETYPNEKEELIIND